MAFCTRCSLRLTPPIEQCPHCGTRTNPYSQEYDSRKAIITMPPEHVLKRRKAFPIRDTLYLSPEYSRSQQGVRVIRKTHRLALSGFFIICIFLLISIYSLLSTGFKTLQSFFVPGPNAPSLESRSVYHEIDVPYTILPTQTILSIEHKATHPTQKPAGPLTIQKAKELINAYYQSINAHDYQSAYALWLHNPYDYTTFASGFVHTKHDTLIFGQATIQPANTVRIALTIQANEQVFDNAIKQLSFYEGYYLIQKQANQSWKIIAARFSRL